jgi:hypothetical protein
MKKLLFIATIWMAINVNAQQTTILTDATIIDGTGRDPQPHMAMIIQDGRITKITRGKIAVPDGSAQIIMSGKYLMPQLISCHSHVGNLKDTITSSNNYTRENVLRQLRHYEDYGVGAILSMGTELPIGISIREDSRAAIFVGASFLAPSSIKSFAKARISPAQPSTPPSSASA